MKGLTERQRDILDHIEDFMASTGMAPTVYEIAEHFRIKTSTVFAHLKALQKKSFLIRSSKARSITLVHPRKRTRRPTGLRAVPVDDTMPIFGKRIRNEIYCDAALIGSGPAADVRNLFAMKVRGSGMKKHGILDGDIAILRKHPSTVKPGDIVLTWVNGMPELRSCTRFDGDNAVFSAEDPGKKAIVCPLTDLPLKGVVIGVQRSLV